MSVRPPYILLDDQISHALRYYQNPVDILYAHTADDVDACFDALTHYHAQGYHIAGYASYELGFALEPKFAKQARKTSDTPLMCFGIFEQVSDTPPIDCLYTAAPAELTLRPEWTLQDYTQRFEKVIAYIKAGDVYQINLTFPLKGTYDGTAAQLYASLRRRQKGAYGGIVSLGENHADIISLSPELFFRNDDNQLTLKPMKGTRPRQAEAEADQAIRQDMQADIKSRAENLMIVDLLRNDISRVCKAGTVEVPELFTLETYPTLHQMTSIVTGQLKTDATFHDMFKSLFPCGSVTGAPKIRAMEIIDELEDRPRDAYCGSMGYIDPDGQMCFNVSIRTLTLKDNSLSYNVGSGIVLDSDVTDEYEECLLKADLLKPVESQLIETFRWEPETGIPYFDRHLARLSRSAHILGYAYDASRIRQKLDQVLSEHTKAQRVRLALSADGQVTLSSEDYRPLQEPVPIALSSVPLTRNFQTTAHKISSRDFYDGERERIKAQTGAQEVIFNNTDGHLCEGSFTSLFIEKAGELLTPAIDCGLLPGILREDLLATKKVREAHLTVSDLYAADKIYIGNALRGLMRAKFIN